MTNSEIAAPATDPLIPVIPGEAFALVLGQLMALQSGVEPERTPPDVPKKADIEAQVQPADLGATAVIFAGPAFVAASNLLPRVRAGQHNLSSGALEGVAQGVISADVAKATPHSIEMRDTGTEVPQADALNIAQGEVQNAARAGALNADATLPAPTLKKAEDFAAPAIGESRAPVVPDTQFAAANTPRVEAPVRAMQSRVEAPFTRPDWPEAFSQRVSWVVQQGHQTADLQLNPPHLGPVEIRVALSSDQASLSFSSPHALVRDAINTALPKLADILREQGISLADVSVGAQSFGQQYAQQQPAGGDMQDRVLLPRIEAVPSLRGVIGVTQLGMVDTFA